MTQASMRNTEFLRIALGERPRTPEEAYVVLPHEVAVVKTVYNENLARYDQVVKNKIEVTGGDDWHDGAFRATDGEATIARERNQAIAPYLGAVVVEYPDDAEVRVTLGSRVTLKQNGFIMPVDIIGFRAGYPSGLTDEKTGEDISGVSPESPLGMAIIGKVVGEESAYTLGERTMNVTIERISQTAVSEYFMLAAHIETAGE